jgi:cell division protein YceG involved in septum cleavage
VIRLLLTVCFINILFSLFLFLKPSEIKEDLIFEIKRGDSYPRIVDNLENIDITIPSFVTVILQYTSLDKNITYGDYLIRNRKFLER